MSLSRDQVEKIIRIVSIDSVCRQRIGTAYQIIPACFSLSGQWRNTKNSIGDTFQEDYSQKTQNEMCIGISAAVTSAVMTAWHKKELPWLVKVGDQRNDPEWFGHYAPKLTMHNGGEYILDWWMTLEIFNPIVWRFADWRQYPSPFVLTRGVQFASFQGFN